MKGRWVRARRFWPANEILLVNCPAKTGNAPTASGFLYICAKARQKLKLRSKTYFRGDADSNLYSFLAEQQRWISGTDNNKMRKLLRMEKIQVTGELLDWVEQIIAKRPHTELEDLTIKVVQNLLVASTCLHQLRWYWDVARRQVGWDKLSTPYCKSILLPNVVSFLDAVDKAFGKVSPVRMVLTVILRKITWFDRNRATYRENQGYTPVHVILNQAMEALDALRRGAEPDSKHEIRLKESISAIEQAVTGFQNLKGIHSGAAEDRDLVRESQLDPENSPSDRTETDA
ncbi:hypothetical protein R1sor_022280 [Riccia sorocarpa]|uniref:Uncharacterized protein n=1 Tax=Riccia sorocarpa TaxID=122646 RepID=A0ABD3GQ95_9MARC